MYNLRQKALERFMAGERKPLLTRGNPKTEKSVKYGYLTAILHLSPVNMVAKKNLCAYASAGCKAACLNTAGRGALHMMKGDAHVVQDARALRTIFYEKDRLGFLTQLEREIRNFEKYAKSKGLKPAVRLNGTSDLTVNRWGLMEKFPKVQFYDYTAIPARVRKPFPSNYKVAFSRKEDNDKNVEEAIAAGYNIAVVFDKLPKTWKGLPVADGDEHDLVFLYDKQVILGLKAKGQAKSDTSGFVVQTVSSQYDDKLLVA